MSRLAPRTICVLAMVLLATAAGVVAPAAADSGGQSTRTVAGTQLAPDDVALRLDVRENRSAVWEVEYRILLDDENKTAAFESVREDARNNESQFTSEFHDRMTATARTAENATGREMEVRNVSVTVTRQQLPQEYGVITYRFVWTEFAAADGDGMRIGDALGGLFLDEETSLLVTWPETYAVTDVRPEPDDRRTRTAVWNGPFDFGSDEPSITLAPRADQSATEAGANGGATASPTAADADQSGDSNALFLGVGLLLVVAVVGGGWVLFGRGDSPLARTDDAAEANAPDTATTTDADRTDTSPATDEDASATSDEDAPGGAASTAAAAGATAGSEASTTADDAGDGDEDATEAEDADEGAGTDDVETPPWEDELLSNEERVLALIEHEGGRLKQQEVAGTLDWTDAKTSQVVRKMRDEDELDAFRLGRENVLVLPEENDDGELV